MSGKSAFIPRRIIPASEEPRARARANTTANFREIFPQNVSSRRARAPSDRSFAPIPRRWRVRARSQRRSRSIARSRSRACALTRALPERDDSLRSLAPRVRRERGIQRRDVFSIPALRYSPPQCGSCLEEMRAPSWLLKIALTALCRANGQAIANYTVNLARITESPLNLSALNVAASKRKTPEFC